MSSLVISLGTRLLFPNGIALGATTSSGQPAAFQGPAVSVLTPAVGNEALTSLTAVAFRSIHGTTVLALRPA